MYFGTVGSFGRHFNENEHQTSKAAEMRMPPVVEEGAESKIVKFVVVHYMVIAEPHTT